MNNTWKIRAKGLGYLIADSFACAATGMIVASPIISSIEPADRKLINIGKISIAFIAGVASAFGMSELQNVRGLAKDEVDMIQHPTWFLESDKNDEDSEDPN